MNEDKVTCGILGIEEHSWKCTKVEDGWICPQAYQDFKEKVGIHGTIKEYQQALKEEQKHNKYVNSYVKYLQRLSNLLGFDMISIAVDSEKVYSEKLFLKSRELLTREEENVVLNMVWGDFKVLYNHISEEELVAAGTEGYHLEYDRYYKRSK